MRFLSILLIIEAEIFGFSSVMTGAISVPTTHYWRDILAKNVQVSPPEPGLER